MCLCVCVCVCVAWRGEGPRATFAVVPSLKWVVPDSHACRRRVLLLYDYDDDDDDDDELVCAIDTDASTASSDSFASASHSRYPMLDHRSLRMLCVPRQSGGSIYVI